MIKTEEGNIPENKLNRRGDILPDGYKKVKGKRLGYYEDESGKKYFYTPNRKNQRKFAKTKANKN